MKRVWITKDGQHLKIKDMSTKHIKNCLKILHKFHSNQLAGMMSMETMFSPDSESAYHCEQNITSIIEDGFEDKAEDFIFAFEQELENRNISPPHKEIGDERTGG